MRWSRGTDDTFLFGMLARVDRYKKLLIRGAVLNGTYGAHKTPCIPLFLLTTFGPTYYDPPQCQYPFNSIARWPVRHEGSARYCRWERVQNACGLLEYLAVQQYVPIRSRNVTAPPLTAFHPSMFSLFLDISTGFRFLAFFFFTGVSPLFGMVCWNDVPLLYISSRGGRGNDFSR